MKHKKAAACAAFFALAALVVIIYFARSPVLIAADLSSILLYGEQRVRSETFSASISLFRRVKTVPIADDAGNDIISLALSEASSRPFCVIFPLRFAEAAHIYLGQNPSIPAVVLEGRFPEEENPAFNNKESADKNDCFLYKTDIESDFYRAALAASLLDGEKNGRIIIFTNSNIQKQAREAFVKASEDTGKPLKPQFFTSFSDFSDSEDISCVVIAGSGYEYFDKSKEIPVILFSWLDPQFIPFDVTLIFNDSPWSQAAEAAGMVKTGIKQGKIKSKNRVLNENNIEKSVFKTLRKI